MKAVWIIISAGKYSLENQPSSLSGLTRSCHKDKPSKDHPNPLRELRLCPNCLTKNRAFRDPEESLKKADLHCYCSSSGDTHPVLSVNPINTRKGHFRDLTITISLVTVTRYDKHSRFPHLPTMFNRSLDSLESLCGEITFDEYFCISEVMKPF